MGLPGPRRGAVRSPGVCPEAADRRFGGTLMDHAAPTEWARAKGRVESGKKVANGTAGQTRAFLRATPVGSVGFGGYWYAPRRARPYERTGVALRGRQLGKASHANLQGRTDAFSKVLRDGRLAPCSIIRCAKKGRALREVEGLLE